jgi:predicted PurR-regulated permease PerM
MAAPASGRDLRPVEKEKIDKPPEDATPTLAPHRPSAHARMVGLQGFAIVLVGVVVAIGALRVAAGLFIPIAFGVVLALALAPAVRKLERIMPRWTASAVVVFGLVGLFAFTSYSMSDDASRAIEALPRAARTLRETFRTLDRSGGLIGQLQQAAKELERTATESTDRPATPSGVTAVQVVAPPVDFSNFVWLGSQGVLAIVGQFSLIMFLVYFLLASGDLFKRKLMKLSGDTLTQRKVTVQVMDQIGDRVAKSLSHLIVAGVVVGFATWGMLAWFGVRYAGLWGLGAGLLNCVPYLGPAVVAAGLLLASLVQFGELGTAFAIAGVSLVITTVEGSLFTPIVFGRAGFLNPVAVFVSFLFWGWLWGIAGMLLALPLLMIIKTIAESVEDLAPLAELLSD